MLMMLTLNHYAKIVCVVECNIMVVISVEPHVLPPAGTAEVAFAALRNRDVVPEPLEPPARVPSSWSSDPFAAAPCA